MKKLLLALALCTYLGTVAAQNYDIRNFPASKSKDQSLAMLAGKRALVLERWKSKPMDSFPETDSGNKGLGAMAAALARVVTGFEVDQVNDFLLDKKFKPGPVGTRINLYVCKRDGDYDFVLQELIRMAYWGKDVISTEAYDRLVLELLNQKGNKHHTHFTICVWKTRMKDTENHILMTEAARYLTNQIMFKRTGEAIYDNEANGFNIWLMDHLKGLFKHGFSEINSKPYSGYTISALLNLYDFSENTQIKMAARSLLDHITMKYAMESAGNRRFPTYRRQVKHYHDPRLDAADPLNGMMMFWVGNYDYLFNDSIDLSSGMVPYGVQHMMRAALSSYRPHDAVYETIFELKEGFQFNKFEHGGVQLVYRTSDYVVSAGGIHRRMWPSTLLVNDVLAVPTMLIPNKSGSLRSEIFQFKGNNKTYRKSNMCVAKNFMCGLNFHAPPTDQSCYEEHGNWTFYDFTRSGCTSGPYEGLYIAAYKRDVKGWILRRIKAKNYGLLEVKKADGDFAGFQQKILASNTKAFTLGNNQNYTTSDGRKIVFHMDPKKGQLAVQVVTYGAGGRIRGTNLQQDDNTMRMFSPRGYYVEYHWGESDYISKN